MNRWGHQVSKHYNKSPWGKLRWVLVRRRRNAVAVNRDKLDGAAEHATARQRRSASEGIGMDAKQDGIREIDVPLANRWSWMRWRHHRNDRRDTA